MFNSLTIPVQRILAPLAMSAAILSLSATAVRANHPIIIHRSPYAYPQTGNYIYGSPIPTAIPLNPVTGKPVRLETQPTVPYHPGRASGRTRRQDSHHSNRGNTIIVNPTIIVPHGQHYSPYGQYYTPSVPSQGPSIYYRSPAGWHIQFGN